MKVLIEAPFSLTDETKKHIEEKCEKLTKFFSKITQITVFFKKGDGTKDDAVTVDIQANVPGPVIAASHDHPEYMAAFAGAVDKIERQLRKKKEQMVDHHN